MSFRERSTSERKDASFSNSDAASSSLPPGLPRPPSAPRTSRPSVRTGREHGLSLTRSGSSTPDADSDDTGRSSNDGNHYSLQARVEQLQSKLAEERKCRLLAEKLLVAATACAPHVSVSNTTRQYAAGRRASDESDSSTPRSQIHSPLSNEGSCEHRPSTALRYLYRAAKCACEDFF